MAVDKRIFVACTILARAMLSIMYQIGRESVFAAFKIKSGVLSKRSAFVLDSIADILLAEIVASWTDLAAYPKFCRLLLLRS